MGKSREKAMRRLSKLPEKTLEDIALIIETADMQGNYYWGNDDDDDGSIWRDDAQLTLDCLAGEIRELKKVKKTKNENDSEVVVENDVDPAITSQTEGYYNLIKGKSK